MFRTELFFVYTKITKTTKWFPPIKNKFIEYSKPSSGSKSNQCSLFTVNTIHKTAVLKLLVIYRHYRIKYTFYTCHAQIAASRTLSVGREETNFPDEGRRFSEQWFWSNGTSGESLKFKFVWRIIKLPPINNISRRFFWYQDPQPHNSHSPMLQMLLLT